MQQIAAHTSKLACSPTADPQPDAEASQGMTRFIYITDTHLGADPMGYQQQKGYPEKLPEILAALREYLCAKGNVDFVLHGGDMINVATDGNIVAAVASFDFPIPVHLCLGNHDLTVPDALDRWLRLAPDFFCKSGSPEYSIATEDCIVHVAPNHWEDRPYYWGNVQNARLSKEQIVYLTEELNTAPHLPHVVLTHSPVYGLPVEQTGFSEPHHSPNRLFTACMTALVARHANVKCVLGAHNHMNMRVVHKGVDFVTVSSLAETPFEFKLFEVTPRSITMSTVSLNNSLNWNGEYDAAKAFVQGRTVDRSFSNELDIHVP